MNEERSNFTPISPQLFGDQGAWTWEVPTLWKALSDPDGPWVPPASPWLREHDLHSHIAYWAPLLTLTYAVLGWPRPEAGVQRWIDAGRPTDQPALAVLDRWWGSAAIGLAAWAQRSSYPEHYSQTIAAATSSALCPPMSSPAVPLDRSLQGLVTGEGDGLHLGHVLDHLLGGPEFGGLPTLAGRLIADDPNSKNREASLLLHRYAGWYGALARLGGELPHRADGRSWHVHVTVAPLGFLGTYRQSRVTGRWFTGRHSTHMLGWTD